jgi:hypothetical protein
MTEQNHPPEMSLAEYKLRQEINDQLSAISQRLVAIETELNRLKTYGFNSPSQLHRAFAAWGYVLLAQVLIAIGFLLIYVVFLILASAS